MISEAERITRALQGHWYGSYGLACCPAHNNTRTPALSLSNGESGRLLAHCFSGCSFSSILNGLRRLDLLDKSPSLSLGISIVLADKERAAKELAAIKRENQARQIWQETRPIQGTPAETYLRTRGITCTLPASLRFHPKAWHGPSAKPFEAMVALVGGVPRTAVHRTYLKSDGSGKAAFVPNKMMLGAVAGGAVRLNDGGSNLVVAEGIETALSLQSGLLKHPVTAWASLSANNMANLYLPRMPGQLTIAVDGDTAGYAASSALAKRAHALGWKVWLLPAPEGQDWNDVLVVKAVAR
jgi:hypothetical protein